MHHADAAHAAPVGFAHESGHGRARLVAIQAMQVHLTLHRPMAASQPGDDVGTQAGATKTQPVVGQQQRLERDLVRHRFTHGRLLVELALPRMRQGPWPVDLGQAAIAQSMHRADGAREEIVLNDQTAPLFTLEPSALGGFDLGAPVGIACGLPMPAQVGQGTVVSFAERGLL